MLPKTKKQSNKNIKPNWYADPCVGHAVQFYPDSKALVDDLYEYVSTGLESQASCLVIASKKHITMLNKMLGQTSPRYVAIDAREALSSFMVNDRPDKKLFQEYIGSLVEETIREKGRPVRAYGEMVALLWEDGNKQAVIELEQLWNGLAEKYDFSLFCGYPDLHFIMDTEARKQIMQCHNLHAVRT